MDNSSRNSDRSRFMRSLSQAAAGWQAEVLQRSVQAKPSQPSQQAERDERGSGGQVFDPLDLRHSCEQCGTVFERFSYGGRLYCSSRCAEAARTALERQARAAENAKKLCVQCDRPMPPHKKRNAVYCSNSCACKAAARKRAARSTPRKCETCGNKFHPDSATRRFCSHACSVEATRIHPTRECEWCGGEYRSRNKGASFCSLSCVSKAGWASGRLRHFPRKLTAERLDRLLAPPRRKRRYVQRLTRARLDKILDRLAR